VAGLRIVESLQVSEVAVDEGGVGQRPQVVGRLELRRLGRQAQQVEVLKHAQRCRDMPAGLVTRMICLVGPAPAYYAKAASPVSNRWVLTVRPWRRPYDPMLDGRGRRANARQSGAARGHVAMGQPASKPGAAAA
jgi:hypothetical protein